MPLKENIIENAIMDVSIIFLLTNVSVNLTTKLLLQSMNFFSAVPNDLNTKAEGSYYLISPLLISGFIIYKNIHGVGELIALL